MAKAKINKQPGETFFIGVDITNEIIEGDTVSIGDSEVLEYKANADGIYILSSSNEILDETSLKDATGNVVEANIADGVDGEKFKISFRVGTTNGDIFEGDVFVTIKEL